MSKKTWNDRYGKDHNKRRRERYKNDPAYREQVKARRREQYHRSKGGKPAVTRVLNGVTHEVYRLGDVEKMTGLSQFIVRDLQARKIIPKPSFPGVHRVYTADQVQKIRYAYDLLQSGEKAASVRAKIAGSWAP